MKKMFIFGTGLLLVAALSVTLFAGKTQDTEKSLLMRNVEAIAQGESPDGWTITGTSTDYWVNGVRIYTVLVKWCDKGGPMPHCTPETQTIYY